MATSTSVKPEQTSSADLQELAKKHLWMHFTAMGHYADAEVPIIVRGEGAYVYDDHGDRKLDGLAGLFCVNAGHGRPEIAEAAAAQMKELDFTTIWGHAHPRAIELAARIAELAPADLNHVFFTNSGSEAVESAIKLARNWHREQGKGQKSKFIAREVAYHGTTLGALAATGLPTLRSQFEPLVPGGHHVPNTHSYRWPEDRHPLWAADEIEEKIIFEGPETVAAVILEPLQNAGGCIPPQEGYFQRVREICDKYDVLLISDETICAWGRLGYYFGCERYDYVPDIITTAKALTSAYAPMGCMIASERLYEPFWRSPSPTSTSSSATTSAVTCSPTRASSGPSSKLCTTCRSSGTSVATVTSTRSSWFATRRPRRASPTRRPRSCCRASCRASFTSAA
jgi:adenosylmethionine-8-amino-7-oxononanoate aminotransferase